MTLTSLEDIFRMQDASAQQNRSELSPEFSLLEEALLLMAESIEFLKSDLSVARQVQQSGKSSNSQKCQLNLAQESWASTVNVCRLLSIGAFTDMFNLYRSAVETYSIWYLRQRPRGIKRWIGIISQGQINQSIGRQTLPKRAGQQRQESKTIPEWSVEHSSKLNDFRIVVKNCFEGDVEKGKGRKDLSKMLSTMGAHTNPYSMFGSLPSETHEKTFGFLSVGNMEFLNYGMYYSLILLKSNLEEINAGFENYIPTCHELSYRYVQLQGKFNEYVQSLCDDWVLRLPPGRTSI